MLSIEPESAPADVLDGQPSAAGSTTEHTAGNTADNTSGETAGGTSGDSWRSAVLTYVVAAGLTTAAVTVMMRLWRATLSVPFWYSGSAPADAGYFKNTLQFGWYDRQPDLGVPFGQHYQYASSPGDLNALLMKLATAVTGNCAVAFNLFFLAGFPLAALTAVWFFRVCGLRPWFSVVLSVLFAVAPYHFLRNENQIFLSMYFCVPPAMVLVLRALRGQPLWGRREHAQPLVALLTGRGAGTVAALLVLAYSGADYALFGALLLVFGGLCGVLRSRSGRRLGGVAAAGGVLGVGYLVAVLPALVRAAGSSLATPTRLPGAETYSMKFASLLLPSPGEPIGFLARARALYDANYPVPGEPMALGLVAACGFVVMLLVAVTALSGRRPGPGILGDLTVLAVFTFCLGVLGGLGTIISAFVGDFSGWGRLSIVLGLLCLAAVGLGLEWIGDRRQPAGDRRVLPGDRLALRGGRLRLPALAVVVLVLGLADQSLTGAVPDYSGNAAAAGSDRQFVQQIQASVPAGSMIFQLPYVPFSHSGAANDPAAGDQLALWLQSSTLRWSAGGLAGRPQTDWPATLVRSAPVKMVRDLAAVGFVGITVDLGAPESSGTAWVAKLAPQLGSATITSPDRRYIYLPMTPVISTLDRTTTAAQRAAIAAAITGSPTGASTSKGGQP